MVFEEADHLWAETTGHHAQSSTRSSVRNLVPAPRASGRSSRASPASLQGSSSGPQLTIDPQFLMCMLRSMAR